MANEGELSAIKDPQYKIGSYRINWWVNDSDNNAHTDLTCASGAGNQKNSMMIPVLSDAGFMLARPQASDDPPPHDGLLPMPPGAGWTGCNEPAQRRVNILYMDWTVRKVSLKDCGDRSGIAITCLRSTCGRSGWRRLNEETKAGRHSLTRWGADGMLRR